MGIDLYFKEANEAYDRWMHREQQDACTDHDDTPYPGLPDATWDDIETAEAAEAAAAAGEGGSAAE